MLENRIAGHSSHHGKRRLLVPTMLAICAAAHASSELRPIEVPPEHERDNVLTRWLQPMYPVAALKNKTAGMVTIEFDTDMYGKLSNVEVIDSTPPGVFDEAVLKTLSAWTFVPFRASRCSTRFPRTRISVNFNIESGKPKVTNSKPIPLARHSTGSTADNLEAGISTKLPTAANDDAVKKPELRWKVAVKPAYPLRSRESEAIYGDVAALITVLPDGSVGETKILFSAPNAAFGEEAAYVIKSWQAETTLGQPPGFTEKLCQSLRFRPPTL